MSKGGNVTRRTWLKELAAFSAVGMPLILASTAAKAKASKAAVHYRDQPNGTQMCHMCKFYIAAGACQVVEGRISPMGWCDLYAPA